MMKIHVQRAFVFLIALTTFSACKKKHDDPIPPPSAPFDIYAAGREGYVAKYWKNGNAVTIGGSTGASDANAMVVAGADVHVAGFEINAAGRYVAKYWKNGVSTSLTDGTRDAFANDIFIQGNDVYVAGQEIAPGRSTYQAKYWKNGTPVILSSETQPAIATGIAVVGNDIYVIGERRNLDWPTTITCYWKNGQVVDLSDRIRAAGDQAMTVAGSDIYQVWSETYNSSGQSQTRYSKNLGTPVVINDGTPDIRGNSIAVNGSDVYIAGFGTNGGNSAIMAKYWKNGSPVILSSGPESAFGLSIALSGTDVYVGGYRDGAQDAGYGVAQYWKNGTVQTLTNGTKEALIRKIVVVKK
jgi:hypothetical protein